MSKTNVFTLIATVLLGVLLYTISRFTGSLPEPPPANSIREAAQPAASPAARTLETQDNPGTLPRIRTQSELLDFLSGRGIDGPNAIADSADWFQKRGFFGLKPLLGVTENDAPDTVFQSMDDDALRKMSEAGNPGASQTLASRALFTDPFSALDWYRRAAAQGSVYAIMQIGALLESLTDMSLDEFVSGPEYRQQLSALRNGEANASPKISALSHALAGARDGGLAIIDGEMLKWMQRLANGLSELERQSACERSSRLFLEIGAQRRREGLQPIATDPPPVFLSIPELQQRLPCRTTGYPIIQLLDVTRCSQTLIMDGQGERMNLNICKTTQGSRLIDLNDRD